MRMLENPPPAKPLDRGAQETVAVPRVRSSKIRDEHLEKLAIVYVRQSSPQQVLEHRESTARQYALVDSATALGWPRERVLVIDEDQGQSGRSAIGRLGFQRLLAELTMDHIGLVLGLEMSRLARSDKDWHHLLELCGVFGTLLADQDGVYDAADPNDRLLLGLKGAMSSLELQTMRNRLHKGKLSKALRGELFVNVPMGYVRIAKDKVALDPDEQARSVMTLVFEKFDELGTINALFRWLVHHDVRLPIRLWTGPRAGQLEWRRPVASTLDQVLHHPMYAGAYSYGRRLVDARRQHTTGKRNSRAWVPMDQWQVLIRDRLPAYISWEQYVCNLERMRQNRMSRNTLGAPRSGRALLCGLVMCGRCGWRLQTAYQDGGKPHYHCRRHHSEANEPCGCFAAARDLDGLIAQQVIRALQPAALELSLKAQSDVRKERDRLDRHWQQTLQRARYEAEVAERRYRAVEPENRMVAATLERQWEDSLRNEREAKEEYDRFCQCPLVTLSAQDEMRIKALASDIDTLWHAAPTTNADRQAVVRCLIRRVVLHASRDSQCAEATILWAGGHESRLSFIRSVQRYQHLHNVDQLLKRVTELRTEGHSTSAIATALNNEGFLPINPRRRFTDHVVLGLFDKLGIRTEIADNRALRPKEWWLHALAEHVGMRLELLRVWAIRGWVHARQTSVQKLWIIWADRDEIRRLRKLVSITYNGRNSFPDDLTSPKQRPKGFG